MTTFSQKACNVTVSNLVVTLGAIVRISLTKFCRQKSQRLCKWKLNHSSIPLMLICPLGLSFSQAGSYRVQLYRQRQGALAGQQVNATIPHGSVFVCLRLRSYSYFRVLQFFQSGICFKYGEKCDVLQQIATGSQHEQISIKSQMFELANISSMCYGACVTLVVHTSFHKIFHKTCRATSSLCFIQCCREYVFLKAYPEFGVAMVLSTASLGDFKLLQKISSVANTRA